MEKQWRVFRLPSLCKYCPLPVSVNVLRLHFVCLFVCFMSSTEYYSDCSKWNFSRVKVKWIPFYPINCLKSGHFSLCHILSTLVFHSFIFPGVPHIFFSCTISLFYCIITLTFKSYFQFYQIFPFPFYPCFLFLSTSVYSLFCGVERKPCSG